MTTKLTVALRKWGNGCVKEKRKKEKGFSYFLFLVFRKIGKWAIILPHFLTSAHFLATKHALRVISLETHSISISFFIDSQLCLGLPLATSPISYDHSIFLIDTLVGVYCAVPNHLHQSSFNLSSIGETSNFLQASGALISYHIS